MIVVAEGPSAAGKTTWSARWGERTVPEAQPTTLPPDLTIEERAERFGLRNTDRWTRAVDIEARLETAVCDGDPLKVHYDYCLARVGEAGWDGFESSVRVCREAIAARRLGIADLIVCSFPDDEILRRQKEGDATRTRHRFELHRRLGPSLRDWYATLDRIDPGRVCWSFPDALPGEQRRDRYDVERFDEWMEAIPR